MNHIWNLVSFGFLIFCLNICKIACDTVGSPDAPIFYEYLAKINQRFFLLPCGGNGSFENFEQMEWYKDKKKLKDDGNPYVYCNSFLPFLVILNVKESDEGEYLCRGMNLTNGEMISRIVTLKVNVPPKIINTTNYVEAFQGEKSQLICKATGIPKPTITWIIPSTGQEISANKDGVLHIDKVTDNETVHYKCKAENDAGSDTLDIVLSFSPKNIKPKIYKVIDSNTTVGDDGYLQCEIHAYPEPVVSFDKITPNFERKRQMVVKLEPHPTEKYKYILTLYLEMVDVKDDGLYECLAHNSEGTAVQNVTLTVKDYQKVEISSKGDEKLINVTSVPGPPALFPIGQRNRKSVEIVLVDTLDTPNQIKLNWVYPFDNVTLVDTYLLKYCRASKDDKIDELHVDLNSCLNITFNVSDVGLDSSYVIENLDAETYYFVSLTAENAIGRGPACEQFYRTREYYKTINFIDAPREQIASKGSRYKIRCRFGIMESPYVRVYWYKTGESLEFTSSWRYTKELDGLVIHKVEESDYGVYECRASDSKSQGKAEYLGSVYINLKESKVNDPPVKKSPFITHVLDGYGIEGGFAQMQFVVQSNPKPQAFFQKLNRDGYANKTRINGYIKALPHQQFFYIVTLPFPKVNMTNAGAYLCTVYNKLGKEHSKVDLIVKYGRNHVPGEPIITNGIADESNIIELDSARHFELMWEIPPSNGPNIDSYLLETCLASQTIGSKSFYIKGNTCVEQTLKANEISSYVIEDLDRPNSHYYVSLRAHNAAGFGPASRKYFKTSDGKWDVITAKLGENVSLSCGPWLENSAEGPTEFTWYANNMTVVSNGSRSPLIIDFVEQSYDIVNMSTSLILRNITIDDALFVCLRAPHGVTRYSYLVRVNRTENVNFRSVFKPIEFQKLAENVTLPCVTDDDIGTSTRDSQFEWIMVNTNKQKSRHRISWNTDLLDDSGRYYVALDRSLIIRNFTPNHRIYYECHLKTGSFVKHYTPYEEEGKNASLIKKKILVGQGNEVTLNCSIDEQHSDFIWIHNDKRLLSIGDVLIKNRNENDNLKIHTDRRSLVIVNFSSALNGIYTCFSRAGISYAYNVTQQESTYEIIDTPPGEYLILPCCTNCDEDVSNFVWIRNKTEVLFMNGLAVAGSKPDKLDIADNKRSLIIKDFSIPLMGIYVCHSDIGINYTYNITVSDPSDFENRKTIFVEYGTKKVVLPCPKTDKAMDAQSKWFYDDNFEGSLQRLLFVNDDSEIKTTSLDVQYELRQDRSLVIDEVRFAAYGVYTCAWNTGEKYVYDVTLKAEGQWVWNVEASDEGKYKCRLSNETEIVSKNIILWVSFIHGWTDGIISLSIAGESWNLYLIIYLQGNLVNSSPPIDLKFGSLEGHVTRAGNFRVALVLEQHMKKKLAF